MCVYIYIYIHMSRSIGYLLFLIVILRPFFILIIIRPRIFESKFRNYCAKIFDGALRKSTFFV